MADAAEDWTELARVAIDALTAGSTAEDPTERQRALIAAANAIQKLAQQLRGRMSGRSAVLAALQAAFPAPVPGSTLRILSGIQESARRIRELRVEEGYDIEALGDSYRLVSLTPDQARAARWRMLNELRRRRGSAVNRLRSLFLENVGQTFTLADVEYVAGISSAARRVRQLRTEEGLRIESHKDNPALRVGEYLLIDAEPIPAMERSVSASRRAAVLERDGRRCTVCGRCPDADRRVWLEVDHIVPLADHGTNEVDNLRTLCNLCHRGRRSRSAR